VPAAAAEPGRLPARGTGRPRAPLPGQDRWPPAGLDDLLAGPLQDLRTLLAEHPELAADAELTAGPELAEKADLDGPPRTGREVLKAGFWDRTRADGAGFAAGGVGDSLPPGPVLAGLAADAWDGGLARLSDDELIGVLRAARRLTSWGTALELAATGDLWRRRVAEEDAGDRGAAAHVGAEIAAALTVTNRAGDRLLDLALALRRLPATSQALAAGDIDAPRAIVIANEVTGLSDEHAAAVDQAVIGAAPGQTTGQLSGAARRAVIAADPTAARRRKEQALQQARVERWDEHSGTAALAGRDLPPAAVLAADNNLTALAKQLKAAGTPGTLDTLRAQVYLALLTGAPATSLLPANPGPGKTESHDASPGASSAAGAPRPSCASDTSGASSVLCGPDASGASDTSSDHPAHGTSAALSATGTVNLTLPLATWLGLRDDPGHCAGYGPLDAAESRDLASALARRAGNKWCLTITGPRGHPVAHGCTRVGPAGNRRSSRPTADPRDGPTIRSPGGPWSFTMTSLTGGDCDHTLETPAYRPSAALRHLIEIRHATCVFPGCRRPAAQCDIDHTIAYDRAGKTCLCNLASLCRHHHEVKQTAGWTLEQTSPGTLTWTTPAGRRYLV
jgi:hypothetical protein